MNKLEIKGAKNLLSIEVPNIFGGFGDDERSMLIKTIAKLQEREVCGISQLINENCKRFIDGVHILDLKDDEDFAMLLMHSEIMARNAINASNNRYILNKRSYIRLLRIMDDDKGREQWDIIKNEYFDYSDVIDRDKKLIEGYLAIVKELAIRNGVSFSNEGAAI